jgi:hypothetical protein
MVIVSPGALRSTVCSFGSSSTTRSTRTSGRRSNTTAEFDDTTGALTNPTVLGALTGATNSARRIQLATRFTF